MLEIPIGDFTGNITLAAGSLLDLRGGGHVLSNGRLQSDSKGVPLGSGGNLSLVTYQGLIAPPTADGSHPQGGQLALNGVIDALGFNGGGSLTLQTVAFQIGGDAAKTPSYSFYFDPTLWGERGFASFNLSSVLESEVPAGAIVRLTHDNLLPDLTAIVSAANGADPSAYATAGFLTGTLLSPTNLSVTAGLEENGNGFGLPSAGSDYAQVDPGAQILGNPGATISIASYTMTNIFGAISAPGGSISLAVTSPSNPGGPLGPLYLGPQSVLDVSGTTVINPLAKPVATRNGLVVPYTGQILPGGTINLSDDLSPILVAPGAILNVSGAAGAFDVAQLASGGSLGGQQLVLVRQPVWSDAGRVNIAGATDLLFEGTLIGNPGAAQAAGATLSITGDALANGGPAGTIVLINDVADAFAASSQPINFNFATYVPSASKALQGIANLGAGRLLLGADRINGSGFSSLVLSADSVVFAGTVALDLPASFIATARLYIGSNAGNFGSLALPGGATPTTDGASLTVNAPYISISGVSNPSLGNIPASSDATLTLNAAQIDISAFATLYNIGQANFNSSGDIRLLPQQSLAGVTQLLGGLWSNGSLAFKAADIYPATDTAFVIEAIPKSGGPSTTVTFAYPVGAGPSTGTPLSAGGALLVDATNIIQNGEIQAPFGSIILGISSTGSISGALGLTAGGINNYFPSSLATQSVTLGSGSITSVSANGQVIPYGSTVDQTTWIYNPQINNPSWAGATTSTLFASPLTSAPQGVVTLTGASVAFKPGATINLSGGGDLQAQEWIPGTGGSRDVLSQINTSYANSTAGTKVPLYADNRQIYAILPGYNSKVAPYDATLSQAGLSAGQSVYLAGGPGLAAGYYTLLPAKYATLPGAFRVVVNSGVTNPLSNQTVTLPDGTMEIEGYFSNSIAGTRTASTAQFFVQSASTWGRYSQYALTSANSFFPTYASQNNLAAPNIPIDAGRLALTAVTGLTLGGTLLGSPAAGGTGGQVDISAQYIDIVDSLTPGGATTTTIGGNSYVLVSAADLSALNATSLLIGGTRALTTAGTVITPTANGVQVSNDAADPLSAPEIMLVAAPLFQNFTIRLDNDGDSATIKVPVASTGQVVFNAGSVVQATGSGAGVGQNRLILGSTLATLPTLPSSLLVSDIQAGNSSNAGALLIANYYAALDAALGTLVRVSNGDPVTVQLPSLAQINPNPAQNTPGSTPGQIPVTDNINAANPVYNIVLPWLSGAASGTGAVIQSGATISAGNSLTLATTGDVRVASGAQVSAKNIAARSSSITFLGSGTDPGTGLVIDAGLQAALQQATSVNLQSYGAIQFLGNVNIAMTNAQGSLTLGGGSLSSDGGQVTIAAPTLVLDNELGAAVPGVLATGAGSLSINAGELVFGDGAKSLTGFGSVSLVAQQGVLGQGTGTMNFGSLPVTLQTPIVIADTGSTQTLMTTGALSVLAAAGPAMTSAGLGGAITLQGGTVTVAAPIQALAGNITLQASAGDVTVTAGGSLIAHGVAKQFFDVVEYASAGSITLTADHGTVNIQSGAVVDFAGASLGGNGGGLTITTTNSSTPVALDGTLLGSTAAGYNGSIFDLTTGASANLDSLAQILTGAGVTGGIGVHTGQGDLTLSQGNGLIASQVALVADGGSVVVNGVIDASGSAGGTIQLYGTGTVTGTNVAAGTGVIVNGSLLARASDPSQLGGTVEIGTSGHFDPVNGTYNTNYGYESVAAANSGTITIGANALIDVSGGAVGGLTGGTVLLRAPLLADGSVNVHINLTNPSQQIVGARSVTLESYAVWSTTDNATTTGAAKHFDGIVDPAGWYDGSGHLLSGTFTDASGATVLSYTAGTMTAAQLATYLANDYFTPTAANTDATRTAHENFYGYVNGDDTTGTPGTLMGFIQSPGFQPVAGIAGIAHFQPVVGIELDNPSATINSGGIAVLSNWNLGAQDANGNAVFRYNYQGTLLAPHLTLRAVGGVSIKASITDGFYQNGALRAATPPAATGSGFPFDTYNTASGDYTTWYGNDSLTLFIGTYGLVLDNAFTTVFNQNLSSWDLQPPQPFGSFGLSSGAIGNGYYGAYEQYLTQWENYSFSFFDFGVFSSSGNQQPASITTELNTAKALYSQTNINTYGAYIAAYATYINDYTAWNSQSPANDGTLPVPPSTVPNQSLPPSAIPSANGPNSPNVVNNANNAAAIAGMALASQASSTSYRIVAGANLQSANPLALNAAGSGDVTIDGHTTFGVVNGTTVEIVIPTIVRTGTGSIDIAAARNFALLDPLAPGVVYTAGTPVQPAVGGDSASVALGAGISTTPSGNINVATNIGISTLLTSQVNPEDAGNITINVLGNIIGIENVRDTVATNTLPLSAPPSGLTSGAGTFIGQFWSAWLLANPSNPSVPWYVNFGSFDQGIMSIGGNVTVKAGGDIHDLAVSLPTTAYLDGSKALHVIGGGNLSVTAGGSIYSGDFYVGEGRGTIRAGGAITSDFTYGGSLPYPVQTLLAVQYATIDVEARQSADIGGVYDPTYLWAPNMFYGGGSPPVASYQMVGGAPTLIANLMPYVTSMSTASGVSVQSTGGAVTFNSLLVQAGLFSLGASTGALNSSSGEVDAAAGITSLLLPASLNLVALDGGITIDHGGGLYPSATGTLSLVADQSITLAIPAINGVDQNGKPESGVLAFTSVGNVFGNALGKLDDPVGTGILPTGASPGLVNVALLSPVQTHDPALISSGPTDPVQIYALNGSIVDGLQTTGVARDAGNPGKFANAGGTLDQISLIPNAPAQIEAGLDILDLPFFGENFSASDITSLIAGRDIRSNIFGTVQPAAIELAGPGNLLVEAGRDIAFPSQRVSGTTIESGIRTIGNSIDTITNPYNVFISSILTNTSNFQVDFGNPYLPTGGASATVLFGVGPGMDIPAFIAQYIDPATANSFALSTITWRMLDALGNPTGPVLTPQQFWPMFETLAPAQQRLDVERALFAVLDATGKNYNNPSSPNFHQYATGYQAINTLFPAGFGYTANNLEGGTNGANQLVHTGDLDLRGSTIQTQQGGNVSILGPGGRVLVGSSLASPSTNPGSEGILTLEKGSIDIFVDQDVLVAQSRVMTEQGGNILMWSSNGDLDAGKGAKTSVSAPPPKYSCDVDWICAADIKGAVSGAGIATLQSLPNVPVGDANLVAPRGTIDFGAAGVRTSGNLNVAALQYLNTFNVQVQGTTTGIPTVPAPNVGAFTTASNATAATQQAATPTQSGQSDRPSIIIVEVLGYGGGSGDTPDKSDEERHRPQDQRSYNPDGAVQVLGHGNLNDEEKQLLNEDEKRKL